MFGLVTRFMTTVLLLSLISVTGFAMLDYEQPRSVHVYGKDDHTIVLDSGENYLHIHFDRSYTSQSLIDFDFLEDENDEFECNINLNTEPVTRSLYLSVSMFNWVKKENSCVIELTVRGITRRITIVSN